MADEMLPPVIAEIVLRTSQLKSGAAEVRTTMSATADSVEASSARASKAADDSSKRMVMSAKAAGAAAREQAAAMGKSAAEQAAAAGKAAEEFTVAQQKMTAAQKAAAQAAADAAAAAGASADEQVAAYSRAAAAAEVEGEKISKSQRLIGESMGNLGRVLGGPASGPLRGIGNQISETEHKARSLSGTLGEIGKVTVIGGIGGFAAAAYEGVKAATAFQTSLAHIAADSSQKNANQIGSAFLGTMGKSAYSANEMAQSYAQVSKQLQDTAGHALSASQAMQVMNAAQDLAEGSGVALGQATQAVSQMMQAYHLSAGQAAQAADTLYQVSRITSSPISDIAMAAGRLHARLGELAPSLKDVGGLMVAAAQHGMTGSRGIMVMQQGFQTLLSGSTQVEETLKALGVNLYNSQGKFVGMSSVVSQLAPKFAGLSQQTDQLAAKTLFGQSAADLMLSVIRKGPSAFAADQQAATKAGAAHAAAAAQSHTLAHEMEVVKATLDDLATKLGQMLIPVIQSVIGDLSSLVGWFQKNQAVAEALAGVIGSVLAAAVGVFVGQKVALMITAFEDMAVVGSRFVSFLSGSFIPALARTGPGISGIGIAAKTTAGEVGVAGEAIVADADATAAGVDTALGATGIGLVIVGLGVALTELATHWKSVMSVMKDAVNGMVEGAETVLNKLIGLVNHVIDALNTASSALNTITFGAVAGGQIGHIGKVGTGGVFGSQYGPGPDALRGQVGIHAPKPGVGALPPGYTYTASTAYNAKAFPRAENEFITALAAKTGLNPAVIAGWALNEQPPGQPSNPANPYNFLNIGASGGTYRGSPTTIWKNPLTAAAATAQWIKTGTGVPGWKGGGTSITSSAGGSIAQQIAAIQNSGWVNGTANDPTANYPNLASFVRQAMGNATGGTAGVNTTALNQVLHPAAAAKQAGVAGLTSSLAADISKYQGLQSTASAQGNTYLAGVYGKMVSQIQALSKSIEGQAKGSITTQQITLLRDTLHADLAKIIAQGGVAISHANEQFKVAAQVQRFQGLQQTAQGMGNTYLAQAYGSIIKELQALIKSGGGTVTALQKIEAQGGTAVALANKEFAAAATIQRYQSAVQTGSASSLEKILGVSTSGITGRLHAAIQAGHPITGILSAAAAGSGAQVEYRRDLTRLQTSARGGSAAAERMVSQLVAAHKQALNALATQLIALQQTKDAAAINLQATQMSGQAKAASDLGAAQLAVTKDQQTAASQATQMATQQTIDATAVMQAQISAFSTNSQDAIQSMADATQATVTGMQDQTNTQADTLKEKGLYGFNLLAQQLQVQLDVMKAGYDQQIAAAQQNVDATKQTWDAIVGQDQIQVAQVTATQNLLVAQAQQHATMVQLHEDTLIQTAQAHVDTVQLAGDMKTAMAQNAVTLSASGSQAQQKAAAAALALAQAQAGHADTVASAQLTATNTAASQAEQVANTAYQQAQDQAQAAIATANQTLSTDQQAAATANANAQTALQTVQDNAAVAEQGVQDQITIAQAQQQALQQGGGTFNPYTSLTVGANGALSFSAGQGGGNGTLPWQQGGGLVQNNTFNVQQQADTAQLANEIGLLMRPYLTGVSV